MVRQTGSGTKITKSKWEAGRPARLAGLEKYVNHGIQIYLSSWKEDVDQAINDAKMPTYQESRIFWYIALAGNMLRAASSRTLADLERLPEASIGRRGQSMPGAF
jgi:hypothetical protein